ncbi:MAG: hypothetical protein AAF799_25270 [Myxococcota bacterium]
MTKSPPAGAIIQLDVDFAAPGAQRHPTELEGDAAHGVRVEPAPPAVRKRHALGSLSVPATLAGATFNAKYDADTSGTTTGSQGMMT